MNKYIIEIIAGLLVGILLSITGLPLTPLALLLFEYLNLGEYKKMLGAILFLNLFPITIASVYEFYKKKSIDFNMGFILLICIIIGGYFGSKLMLDQRYKLSEKTAKYITSLMGFIVGIAFFISAYNMKSKNN